MGTICSIGLVLAGIGMLALYSEYWLAGTVSLVAGVWGLVALDVARIVSRAGAAGTVRRSAGEKDQG